MNSEVQGWIQTAYELLVVLAIALYTKAKWYPKEEKSTIHLSKETNDTI